MSGNKAQRFGAGMVHLSACAVDGGPLQQLKIITVHNVNNVEYCSVTRTSNNW